jgi:antitoxin component YwqK of YwqJK toxin-antitoxin module
MNNGDKYWHINGVPSRLDISLPYIEMSNGEKYYRLENGEKYYRLENGGKKIIGKLREEWFNKNGRLHREDGPARIWYYENGNPKHEDYYKNGKHHRENGPADTWYYENGNIKTKSYYKYGFFIKKLHKYHY